LFFFLIFFHALDCRAALLQGRVLDQDTGAPLALAQVRVFSPSSRQQTHTDSSGAFALELEEGRWRIEVQSLGYAPLRQALDLAADRLWLDFSLPPLPLLMDELVVRARRADSVGYAPAFVESIPVAPASGGDLAGLLDQALGVQVRRYGGLGSFSTLSMRGSTAEQVQVFLDGVPLNQALGGGVDLGDLPLAGLERIEVYRGAVPARFGGNSLGGVVHLRTQAPGGRRARLYAGSGSFGTRRLGASTGATWQGAEVLGLLDYSASRNDFGFLDDNGTEFNASDDQWTRRRNSDFDSWRGLVKAARSWDLYRLHLHSVFDLSHRGLPGLGNHQALHTRYDTWRHLAEAELHGPFGPGGRTGFRVSAFHLLQQGQYRDLLGEVGTGTQHERQNTRSVGLRTELSALLPHESLLTAFALLQRETFTPENLLQPYSRLLPSRRLGASLGAEVEGSVLEGSVLEGPLLRLNAGLQVEGLADRFFGQKDLAPPALWPRKDRGEVLGTYRVGFELALAQGWSLKGHWGFYGRPPSFFELFGDRGAVLGNSDLKSESGLQQDIGLIYRGQGEKDRLTAELALYRHRVRRLIRFVQNSQRVSTPHNIGRAHLSGLETRFQARPLPFVGLHLSYAYQRAQNRSPFPYERGNDLPNAPRHNLDGRLRVEEGRVAAQYLFSKESRHFLDRANLRPVPSRTVHGVELELALGSGMHFSWEVRNLTANQVADLWGYPLPGRTFFLSLTQSTSGAGE
jgi:iron complex outermembrane receptor protein